MSNRKNSSRKTEEQHEGVLGRLRSSRKRNRRKTEEQLGEE